MAYDSKMSRLPSERDPDNPHDYTFMELYDKDRRSVYFGNLPLDTASHWVEKVAATISKVLSVEMKQPKDPNSSESIIRIPFTCSATDQPSLYFCICRI